MKIDYSKRKHESPFDDDVEKPDSLFVIDAPKHESPFTENLPKAKPSLTNEKPPSKPSSKLYISHHNSEKAQFRVFMGFGLLVPGVCVCVWAYWCFMGSAYYGDYARARLEGSLCAVAGLICFSITGYLFFRAYRMTRQINAEKLDYESLDPQTIPRLRNRIEVRSTRFQNVLMLGLIAFFALLTFINLSHLFTSQFTTTTDIIYKGFLFHGLIIGLIFTFIFLMIRAKRKSVRAFDVSGVMRGDGRQFSWNDFRGTETRIGTSRFALRYVWRIELVFANGERAWLIPQRIKNHKEVFEFVGRLPVAVSKN